MMSKLGPVLLGMLLMAGAAWAQGGSVEGTVVDATGAPVEGAKVELLAADACVHTTLTDADGYYFFETVSPGVYDLKACKKFLGTVIVAGVEVVKDVTTTVPVITLSPLNDGDGNGPQYGLYHGPSLAEDDGSAAEKSAAVENASLDEVKAMYR